MWPVTIACVFLFVHFAATQRVNNELEIGGDGECQNFTLVVEETEGTFVFPTNKQVFYPANCEWSLTLNLGQEDANMALDVESFSLSLTDNLTITDVQFGGTYYEVFWYDNEPDGLITGLQDIVMLSFISDEIHESTGFLISWSIDTSGLETTTNNGLPDDTVFRPVVAGSSDKLTSPNYPGDYPLSKSLYWVLTAPVGETIQVVFQDFLLAFDDYLVFYEGIVQSADTQRAKYTGASTNLPSPVRSLGNQMLVVFVSSQYVNEKGFSLTYSVYVPAPPATTTEKPVTKKAAKPLTAEGRTVLIVLGLLVVLVVAIICVYMLYWRPKQLKEEQRIATELYDNGREPMSVEQMPQRPVSAAQIARLRATANMKSDYGLGANNAAIQMAMLERPMTSAQQPGGAQARPATRQAASNAMEASAEDPGWSSKLEERFTPKSTVIRPKHKQPEQSLAAKVQAAALAAAAAPVTVPTGAEPAVPTGAEPAVPTVGPAASTVSTKKDPLPPLTSEVSDQKIRKKKKSKPRPAAAETVETTTSVTPRPNSARPGSGLKHSSTAPGGLTSSKLPGYVIANNDEEDCV